MSLVSLKEFREDHDFTEVYYAEEHQRREVWNNQLLALFMVSVCRGWSQLTTIVVADVKKCLKFSRKNGDRVSTKYFQRILNKGYRYISLDGQNRSKKIVEFLNDKFPISGTFLDADDVSQTVTNKLFKDFPERLRDRILDGGFLNVEVAPPCGKDTLSDIFLALNSGEPLNAHEKRNSLKTPISDWVRKTRKTLDDALMRVVSRKDAIRMLDDELVAKMAMVLMRNNPANNKTNHWGLSSDEIDRFYSMGLGYHSISDEGCPYSLNDVQRVEEILDMWRHTICNQAYYPPSKTIAAKMCWAVLYVCEWAYDNNYDIDCSSYSLFFSKLKELDDSLISQSDTAYANEKTRYIANNLDPDEVSKQQYYFTWINLPHQIPARSKRTKNLTDCVKTNVFAFGLRKLAA
jgi:hypothetical protein